MLKIDPESMKQAIKEVAVVVGKSIEKEANNLLVVDSFAGQGEGAGVDSKYIIYYQGGLLSSSSVEANADGASINWSVPYASFIEFGARPGDSTPEEYTIENWLTTKRSKNLPMSLEKAKELAPKIQKQIIEKGWQPRPFVRTAIYYVASENYILTGV